LGKLFQSKSVSRNHTELLVIITPEIVRPIPAGQPPPQLTFGVPQLSPGSVLLRQPGIDQTGPVPVTPPSDSMPLELLIQHQQQLQKKMTVTPVPAAPPPGAVPIGQ
jgi:pilus assembly protein CpaC